MYYNLLKTEVILNYDTVKRLKFFQQKCFVGYSAHYFEMLSHLVILK